MTLRGFMNAQNADKSQIFHSSGYARAGRGAGLGSASVESFSKRKQLANAPRLAGSYQRSQLGTQRGVGRARTFDRTATQINIDTTSAGRNASSRQASNAQPPISRLRGYDPYR